MTQNSDTVTPSIEQCSVGPEPVEGPHEAHDWLWDSWQYHCQGQ